mgnify:CR=1 FL=1
MTWYVLNASSLASSNECNRRLVKSLKKMDGDFNPNNLEKKIYDPLKDRTSDPDERSRISTDGTQAGGTVAHDVLAHILNHDLKDQGALLETILQEYYIVQPKYRKADLPHLDKLIPPHLVGNPTHATLQAIQKIGIDLLDRWKYVRNEYFPDDNISSEVPKQLQVGEREGFPVWMLARVDAIVERDGRKIVIEFKTGKIKHLREWEKQLDIYSDMIEKEDGVKPVGRIVVHPFTEEEGWGEPEEVVYPSWNDSSAKLNDNCHTCPVRHDCVLFIQDNDKKRLPLYS